MNDGWYYSTSNHQVHQDMQLSYVYINVITVRSLGLDIPESIVVPPNHEALEIDYASSSNRATEKKLNRFKLDGVDEV